jgi:coenzyme F420-reducing hydrogenase gamma subunit
VAEEVDIQMRGSPPEDEEKIKSLVAHFFKEENEKLKKPADQPVTDKTAEIEELEKYRESERQTILQEFPKELQEEYKEKNLKEVKQLMKVYKSIEKRNVGQEPPITSEAPERPHSWCYKCRKNHSGLCD